MGGPVPSEQGPGPGAAGEAIGFASFTLDLRAGQLCCAGAPRPLRPKTWAVLVYLARRPGVLVSKAELLDAVWPDVAVTPDTLNKSIGELRSALGDDIKQPRFIETVHRRGFRFLPAARSTPAEAGAPPAPAAADVQPFIGRGPELARLERCLAAAAAGERQVVFVSGAAGVGKTALIESFLRSPVLRGRGALVGWGASIAEHGVREPYMPVLEAVARLAQGAGGARVVATLRAAAPSWLAQMPWLAGDDPALLARALQAARPERMLRECVALLESLAREETLVLVLEDLHWSDPSTVDLLVRLGQRREPARLLIVASYRAAEAAVHEHPLAGAVRGLRGQRRGVELPLVELSADWVGDYLAARFPGATPPPGLAADLYAHTDGHPLFLRAVVDHMVARGWILDTAPGWSFAAMPARPAFGVPADARDMVALQIDSLGPADRQLLEGASVAGHDFAPAELALVLERGEDAVEAACEALARGERFLRPLAGGLAPRYAFTHELYRQAVHHDISPGRRQRLHLRVARALEARLGEQAAERAHDLAHHFEQGRDLDRALHYLELAAARARQRSGPREADAYLRHALALLGRQPRAVARDRRERRLLLTLANVLIELHGPAADVLRDTCERALALCEADDDPHLRFQILYALSHVAVTRGDGEQMEVTVTALDDLARRLGEPDLRLLADSILCRGAMEVGRFADCCRHGEAIFAAAAPPAARPVISFGADPVIGARTHYAASAWLMGDTARAHAALRAAAREAAAASAFSRASVAAFGGLIAMLAGDAEEARRASADARQLAVEHDLLLWTLIATAIHGWARMRLGDGPAGMAEILAAQAAFAPTGARIFTSYILGFLAEGHLRAGEVAAGTAAVEQALHVAESTLDRSYLPELWRLKGALLHASAAPRADAEACLRRAFAIARASEARAFALRAALDLARPWLADGRTRQARALLVDALDGFAPDADSRDLREARALLETPSSRRGR